MAIGLRAFCKSSVYPHENRTHCKRQECGPLHQEPCHDENEPHMLRMPYPGVGVCDGQSPGPLSGPEMVPGQRDQPDAPTMNAKLGQWIGPQYGFAPPNIVSGRCPLSWANQSIPGQLDRSQPDK